MATLDIAIVMFALVVILILDILAIGLSYRYFAFLGMIFAIVSLAYFVQNFAVVGIGSVYIIPFQIFIIAWVMLPIFASLLIGIKGRF